MSTSSRTVTIAGRPLHVERVSARKASRAMALLRHINRRAKGIAESLEQFEREYSERNVRYITRPEARVRFPPQVVLDPDSGAPVREPELIPDPAPPAELLDDVVAGGAAPMIRNPRAGELVTFPSVVDRMTEEDWQASGGKYPVRERAPLYAVAMHVFEDALEVAEEHVYRLLALFTMSNEDVARRHRDGTLEEELTAAADRLLDDAMADEVLELAVVCGEVVDQQFTSKARDLGDRLGNALRLFGLSPSPSSSTTTTTSSSTEPNGPSSSTPSSSTDSPSESEPDGPPTSSSMPTTASSSASDESPSEPPSAPPAEAPEPPASAPSATPSAPATTTPATPELAR